METEDHLMERLTADERNTLYSGFKAMLTIAPTPWHATGGWVYSRNGQRLQDFQTRFARREAERLVALVNAARLL